MGIQLHEHMRVPRQSMAGGLGIDAPPADLKVPCLVPGGSEVAGP